MSPDRLSRRVALALVVLVAMLIAIAGCRKEAPPSTESAAEPAVTRTASTESQPMMAETTGTTAAVTATAPAVAGAAPVPCAKPDTTRSRPVVCIDTKTLKVDPKSIAMIDFEPGPGNKPSGTPVRIYWRTTTGTGDLQVKFAAGNKCVTPPNCKPGECSAMALPHQNPKASTTCQYQVWFGGKEIDPVVVVDPCCP